MSLSCLISCEHASNRVPEPWAHLFRRATADLESHSGWDPGALPLAKAFARRLGAELLVGEWTRLLVDLNRSPHNPRRFSHYTRALARDQRRQIDDCYHRPYQQRGRDWIAAETEGGGRVIHLTVHSFTPVFQGVRRRTDLGLLHVTDRQPETTFMRRWQRALRGALPDLKVHRNQPYTGSQDGYIPWLHGQFDEGCYCGLELEINQRLLLASGRLPRKLTNAIIQTFIESR